MGAQKHAVKDMLSFEVPRKIPILKNGSVLGLQFVKVENTKLTVINTCAFDSLYQIFLAGSSDRPTLHEFIKANKDENDWFQLDCKEDYSKNIRTAR